MIKDETTKAKLWADRIKDFNESGLSRKVWCQEHQLSISALGYWLRKISSDGTGSEPSADPVFARLPSEQEISSHYSHKQAPVTIFLADRIQIEVAENCPPELMVSLFSTIKSYA